MARRKVTTSTGKLSWGCSGDGPIQYAHQKSFYANCMYCHSAIKQARLPMHDLDETCISLSFPDCDQLESSLGFRV